VPLSLARLHPACRFGVFEMGMNHPGEIAPLSRLARPDVAVITTVEAVHGAHFDSVEAIAEAKAEVFTGMVPGGTAVLNRDNAHFPRLAAAAAEHGLAVLGFGADGDAALRLDAEYLEPESSRVVVELGGRRIGYALGAPGAHWVRNSLAVLGAVHALGADVDAAAADLADVHPPQGRGRRHSVAVAGGAFDLIDESYNASQVSMLAAMRVLGRMPPGAGGRRMAVLGDMLEIGETAAEMHRALAGAVIEAGIDLVFTAGPLMTHLWDALPAALRGGHAGDIETLAPLVVAAVRPGDVVTVKGSLGSRTGVVVRALLDLGGDDEAAPRRAAMRE
jgi:UDP-N-acetylmuramoyl-tripeptide--D-alanyl-D-alanine ligase